MCLCYAVLWPAGNENEAYDVLSTILLASEMCPAQRMSPVVFREGVQEVDYDICTICGSHEFVLQHINGRSETVVILFIEETDQCGERYEHMRVNYGFMVSTTSYCNILRDQGYTTASTLLTSMTADGYAVRWASIVASIGTKCTVPSDLIAPVLHCSPIQLWCSRNVSYISQGTVDFYDTTTCLTFLDTTKANKHVIPFSA